ncbi:divalent-cation tolerance protein CutA [Desulfurivibrio alkaliphilus]|uniref:CutA1 divalent ion tolerance protein n=1 Tax=Desulfurivibrio alkaliphilus (strain DSM 19089 / UNIQEM U267 / AHT2) TaxID=589865 RepID=D6Z6Q6_DESAT|nr:divalent-cation tolerance protein CutA [Desulfurivibrio alkaliphilus]ADH85015.1 CutA1 divalent ion tolerance protein [Desulfurivibrio alkaliphilus AHT 2]
MEYLEVVTTVATKEDAERIARTLLEEHLAACVQIVGPITSMYRWQGEIERADEYQCQIKCRADHFKRIEESIARIHPYEVPEVVAHPLPACSSAYEKWLQTELRD